MKKIPFIFFIIIPFVVSAQQPKLVTETGHNADVTDCGISNDGKYAITVSAENTSILWNTKTGNQLAIFSPLGKDLSEEGAMSSIQIRHDQKQVIISNNLSSSLRGRNGPIILTFPNLKKVENLPAAITHAVYSIDGKYIAGADNYGNLKIFDTQNLNLIQSLTEPGKKSTPVLDVSNIGKIKKPTEKDIKKVVSALKRDIKNEAENFNDLNCINFSPNGHFVVTAGEKSEAILWNITNGKSVKLNGHKAQINDAKFSADSKQLITASEDKSIIIWDVTTAQPKQVIKLQYAPEKVFFSLKNSEKNSNVIVIFTNREHYPEVFDTSTGKLIKTLDQPGIESVNYTFDGKYFITSGSLTLSMLWNASTLERENTTVGRPGLFKSSQLGNYFVLASKDNLTVGKIDSMVTLNNFDVANTVKKIDAEPFQEESIKKDQSHKNLPGDINFSPDRHYKYEFRTGQPIILDILDDVTGRVVASRNFEEESPLLSPLIFSADSKIAAIKNEKEKLIEIFDLKQEKVINKIPGEFTSPFLHSVSFSPDNKYLLVNDNKNPKYEVEATQNSTDLRNNMNVFSILETGRNTIIKPGPSIVNVFNGQKKSTLESIPVGFSSVEFSPQTTDDPDGGKYLVTTTTYNSFKPIIKVWNSETGKLISTIKMVLPTIDQVRISPDAKYLFTNSDNVFTQWDLLTGQFLSDFHPGKDGKYSFQMTKSGYYSGKKMAIRDFYYVTEDFSILSANQFDLKYNRPDHVLRITGSVDSVRINELEGAVKTRAKNLKANAAFEEKSTRPQIKIIDESFPTKDIVYQLHLIANDSTATLKRLNIWVNNVPEYGSKGLLLKGKPRKSLDTIININLSYGIPNIIETSVVNNKTEESYIMQTKVEQIGEASSRLYFIGIGANNFEDKEQNLKWSINDIRKMAQGLRYHGVNILDTLFDKQINKENLSLLQEKLKKLNVNDRLIIVYSGHGILKGNALYFPTYATDFENPEKTAIPYSVLEDLLDNIAPRRKLMLIDACNSGDYDKSKVSTKNADAIQKNSFELMRDIFDNVERKTGSTIIASCGASGLSMASEKLQHGLLIYAALEAIFEEDTFTNFLQSTQTAKDSPWSVNKLKEYLMKRVPELSENSQQPIIRAENPLFNWNY